MAGPVPNAGALLRDPEVVRAAEDMARVMEIVTAVRSLRAQFRISPAQPVEVRVRADFEGGTDMLARIADDVVHLARLRAFDIAGEGQAPRECGTEVVRGVEVMLPLAGLVDVEAEKARRDKDIAKDERERDGLARKLANEGFVTKAPAAVVEKERERLSQLELDIAKKKEVRARLG
jgi:valyl-tRNA synthetase